MNINIPNYIPYILALSGTVSFIWFLFEKAENTLNIQAKNSISNWLKNVDPVNIVFNWPKQFVAVFDKIFSDRHLSWNCFFRSCVASIISVILVSFLWIFFATNQEPSVIIMVFILSLFFNFIPDYFSLLESRYVINLMGKSRSLIAMLSCLFLDLLLTISIFLLFFYIFASILILINQGDFSNIYPIKPKFFLTFNPNNGPGIWFCSTFFTSIWVWFYFLSGIILKISEKLGIGLKMFRKIFDIDNKPLRSMGIVSIFLVIIIFMIMPFLR